MQTLTTEEAIAWVDENAGKIQGHIWKYMPFAPYDQDDFLQSAYEAAILAAKVSAEREIPFPPCFWVTFKSKIAEVTPYPNGARHEGSSSPPSTLCSSSDFIDWEADPSKDHLLIDMDQLYRIISRHLTPAEDEILSMAIGLQEGRRAIREIAWELGCSSANIRQRLNHIYARLSDLVTKGQLNTEFLQFDPHDRPTVEEPLEQKEDQMTLGEKLRMVRGERTVKNFVSGYGICANTLMNYEADKNKPDAAFLARLCAQEGVDPNWLLGIGRLDRSKVPYRRKILETVIQEALKELRRKRGQINRQTTGELLVHAYERVIMTRAGKNQVETIVREQLELLETREQGEPYERNTDQRRSAAG